MNILSRIIRSSSFRSLFTLVLALFIFSAIFSIKKESKSYLAKKKSVHSTFYVSGSSPLNNQKDIPLWASFYSPTIFIRANSSMNYSYSLLAKNPELVRHSDDNSGDYKFKTRSIAEQNFMKRHFSLMQFLYDNYQPFPIGNKALIEKQIAKQEHIYFMTSNGLILTSLPSFEKLNTIEKVKRTILKVSGLDTTMPLISLIQSSSNQGLDQKALSAIKQALLKTKMRTTLYTSLQSQQGILEVDWRIK